MKMKEPCIHKVFHNYGSHLEIYCRQCNSFIFTEEETKRREMKINTLIFNNPKIVVTIKFMETFK